MGGVAECMAATPKIMSEFFFLLFFLVVMEIILFTSHDPKCLSLWEGRLLGDLQIFIFFIGCHDNRIIIYLSINELK